MAPADESCHVKNNERKVSYFCVRLPGCSVNYQLSICINDRHGSMRIDNGYYNKDYGLLAK